MHATTTRGPICEEGWRKKNKQRVPHGDLETAGNNGECCSGNHEKYSGHEHISVGVNVGVFIPYELPNGCHASLKKVLWQLQTAC